MELYKHWLGVLRGLGVMRGVLCGLVLMGMSSCSGDGGEVVDDVMSQETTPVTFALGKDWSHVLFDYTDGGTYIGSDTIHNSKEAQEVVKLRQGKHQLLWVKGLTTAPYNPDYRFFSSGVHFMRESNTFFFHSRELADYDNEAFIEHDLRYPVYYWKKSLEVSPYLLPVQEPNYVAVTATIELMTEDINPSAFIESGTITGIPVVTEVGMDDGRCKISDVKAQQSIYFQIGYNEHEDEPSDYDVIMKGYRRFHVLCPLDGLNDIQLVVSSTNSEGQTVVTLQLPKCSIRRGYVTRLVGPLFGTANEWMTIEAPYVGYD